MRLWILAASITFGLTTSTLADGQYWVVGNRVTNKCEIVTSNPTIFPNSSDGPFWFGSGPYKSLDDAKLARSTIGQCPNRSLTDD
jgi:hypothetical protein